MNYMTKMIMEVATVTLKDALAIQELLNEPGRIDFSEATRAEIVAEIQDAANEYTYANL